MNSSTWTKGLFLSLALVIGGMASTPAADVAIRFYHPHEVDHLLSAARESFPVTAKRAAAIQFPAHRFPEQSEAVRESFQTDRLIEEQIVVNHRVEEVTEKTFDPLIRMISAAEAGGWEWGQIIAYREPLFDALIENQELHPGPWPDRRLVSPRDVEMMRRRLARAFREGEVAHEHYDICGLIYSWKNVDKASREFILAKLDGLYVELNSRGGNWQSNGNLTTIGPDFANPGHDFFAFGLPGTIDSARMMAWCLKHDLKCGLTMGANLTDVWLIDMLKNLWTHLGNLRVDPGDPRITYLLHHNRQFDDGKLLYFPESEEHSMTWLVREIDREVNGFTKKE